MEKSRKVRRRVPLSVTWYIEWIFWMSCIFVAMVSIGYPLMLVVFSPLRRTKRKFTDDEPTVSLIISAYNEEKILKAKIENTLTLDYPKEKLEIIVASDGSTDQTNEIAEAFNDSRIKLYKYDRIGKTGIQNETVKKSEGKIIVFSDANAIYKKDAIKRLVRNFGDDQVGCVCGKLVYKKNRKKIAGLAEILYWKYETFLKEKETRLSSLIGVNGSIYAIRKKDYVEINNDLISDFVEPLEIVKKGKRVVFEPEAISEEESSSSYNEEFRRKTRILTRSIQGLLHMKTLLNPFRYGFFAVQLLLHKLSRYLIPYFLLLGLLALVLLTHKTFYYVLFCIVITLLICAIIARFTEENPNSSKLFHILYYYFLVNYALMIAWTNVLSGKKISVWSSERN